MSCMRVLGWPQALKSYPHTVAAMMAATLPARAITGMHHVTGLLGGVILDAVAATFTERRSVSVAMSGQGHILARSACCLSQQARCPKLLSPGLLMTAPRTAAVMFQSDSSSLYETCSKSYMYGPLLEKVNKT